MRRLRLQFTLAAAVLALAACGSSGGTSSSAGTSSGGSPAVDHVTVGVIPIIDVAPIYLGKQKGFFSQRNIDLNLQLAQGGAAIVPAVLNGQTQFGFSNVVSMFVANTKGLPIKLLAPGDSSTGVAGKDFQGIAVQGNSPIKTAADLAGKTVGVNTLKNICGVSINASIRKAGGDPSKVKYVEVAPPDSVAALANGSIDADCMGEPFLSQVLATGGRVVGWNFVDVAPNATIAAYFTSQQEMKSNPDLVKRFTAAIQQSNQYADAHPDEARQIVTTYTKIPASTISSVTLPKWPANFNTDSLKTIAKEAQQDGVITKQPDFSTLLP